MFVLQTRANQKSSLRMKTYRRSVLRTRVDQKSLSLMKVLRRRANQKEFTKSQRDKNMQFIKQSIRNLRFYISHNFKETIYFNLFECGKNILNGLDATCKRAYMATSRDKYYTEIYKTLTDYNDRNNAPLLNEKI